MRYKYIIYSIIFIGLPLNSCGDFLDKIPDDQKTMEMVWENQKEVEKYLYSVYSKLPDERSFWNLCPWIGASDELNVTWERYLTASINVGSWNPSNIHYDPWSDYYQAIRASFVFENNVDKCIELSSILKTQYKAEVKFLRGFYYWKLLQQYGPFVLIDKESDINDDWNKYPRTPYDTCVEYICTMMDEAEAELPWTWKTNSIWLGKPDKMACKAVKSEVLLMAASPQWNGNTEYDPFKNQDDTPLVNTTYDENKWRKAAKAAKDVIDAAENNPSLNVRLYKNHEANTHEAFNPFKSVRDVHLARWNCEVLWATTKGSARDLDKHATPRPGGFNGLGVTQRQVDAFYMINGRTIEDPASGYEETGFATEAHRHWIKEEVTEIQSGDSWGHRKGEWNMYANREARFYAGVLYNGRPIPQVATYDRNNYSSNANKDGWGRVELYAYGTSGFQASDHSTTGYLMLKHVDFKSNPYREQYGEWHQHTYIRLAQIYLNYIEALNEFDSQHADIKRYWDKIRERAGLPGIFDTYSIRGDKQKQLEYIIRERQVELCFESDRYFTTRRRWIAHLTDTDRLEDRRMFGDGGAMYGMNISVGDSFNSTDFYQRTKFETRVFTKKMYLFPISQFEMDRGRALVQNPWW